MLYILYSFYSYLCKLLMWCCCPCKFASCSFKPRLWFDSYFYNRWICSASFEFSSVFLSRMFSWLSNSWFKWLSAASFFLIVSNRLLFSYNSLLYSLKLSILSSSLLALSSWMPRYFSNNSTLVFSREVTWSFRFLLSSKTSFPRLLSWSISFSSSKAFWAKTLFVFC